MREILLDEFAKGLDALGLAMLQSITSTATANLPFASSFSFSPMTDEDNINLSNLLRLLQLLSGRQKSDAARGASFNPDTNQRALTLASPRVDQLASVQEILPILAVIPELPPEMQQQLLQLPGNISGKLVSRIAARTIRRIFS